MAINTARLAPNTTIYQYESHRSVTGGRKRVVTNHAIVVLSVDHESRTARVLTRGHEKTVALATLRTCHKHPHGYAPKNPESR